MGKDRVFGPEDLRAYMAQHDIVGEVIRLDVPTPTVETAAAAVGTRPEQIVKSLLFRVGDGVALAITCGTRPVEKRVLASYYGVGRKKVDLADAETVMAVTGYPVGGVPPFGHRQSIPAFLDFRVLNHNEVYAGGGGGNSLVRLNPKDILIFTRAEVVDLHSLPED
jgi:prolyl-tRNA editing enzyme YbaK/EbsC (Cys-tRNA(Pro) deacylase)